MTRRLPMVVLATVIMLSFSGETVAQYKARPVVDSLNPSSGSPGTQVTISGKNFGPEYKIYYNGVELKPVAVSTTQIVVKIPANAVQGRFTLRGPIHQVVSPQVFWVVQSSVAPIVTSITPSYGPPGTVVAIVGKHFSAKAHENAVTVGGVPLQVRAANATRIDAVVPLNAKTGNITVQVYNAGQATSQQSFTVLAELKIDSVTPQAGPPGTKVTFKGSGFSPKKKNNTVTLADVKCKILRANSHELLVQIPAKGAQSGRFGLEVKGVGKIEHSVVFPVAYPPQVNGFSPASGRAGTEATIQGSHFSSNPRGIQVLLTGQACQVLAVSDDEIRVRIPRVAVSGPFEVVIDKMGSAASKKVFEVWAPLAVTRMEPLYGLPGTEIKIWGTGFKSDPSAHTLIIGNKSVKIDRLENGALIFKIPEDAPDGQVVLRLEVKDRGASMIAMPLTIMHSPMITDFSPKRGPAGTVVTITGNYFGTNVNHIRVMMGTQIVQASAVTPTMIRLTIPQGVASAPFSVATKRRGEARTKKSFETFIPVHLTNFLPSMGFAGQVVNLFGNGFETVAKRNKVTLNGQKVQVLEASATRLKVKLSKKSQTGRFRVEVPTRGFSESPLVFNIVDKLEVKTFVPVKGIPGTYVKIKGRGFQNKGLRGYIGQKPIGVRIDSPTQVTVAIPAGSMDGPFVFTAPGAGRAASTSKFRVMTPLTITGFQPTQGYPGTKVSIYGTGFDLRPRKSKVVFGNQALAIEPGSSENMLVVTIPKGAQEGSFKVSVKEKGQSESENVFMVYAPAAAAPPAAVAPVAPQPQPVAAVPQPVGTPVQPAPGPAPAAQPPPASMDELMGIDASAAPKIEFLDPPEGPIGETIMIGGSGFGEDMNSVKAWIGKAPAVVVGVVPDMVMIEVPGNVRRGKIRIKIGNAPTVSSKDLFKVTE
jgi:IPT/TIG domain